MKPLSGRVVAVVLVSYTALCVLLGVFVAPGFYVALVALGFARPVLREAGLLEDRDEWQTTVSQLSPEFAVGGLPLVAAFLALRWQRVGGVILLLCGAVTGYFFVLQGGSPEGSRLFVALMLPAPLLLAGVLLVLRSNDEGARGAPGAAVSATGG